MLVAALALSGCGGQAEQTAAAAASTAPASTAPASTAPASSTPASSTPTSTSTTDPFEVDLIRIAAMFVDRVRSNRPKLDVPIDTPVDLYLGEELITTISAKDAYEDRDAWEVCGSGAGDRTCPLSALDAVRSMSTT